jgi:hypothetical protein
MGEIWKGNVGGRRRAEAAMAKVAGASAFYVRLIVIVAFFPARRALRLHSFRRYRGVFGTNINMLKNAHMTGWPTILFINPMTSIRHCDFSELDSVDNTTALPLTSFMFFHLRLLGYSTPAFATEFYGKFISFFVHPIKMLLDAD